MKKGFRSGVYKSCDICKKDKYINPCRLNKSFHYCSLKCRNKDKRFWERVRGKNHWNWKGGKMKIGEYIYTLQYKHPYKNSGGYVAEHRLVMEKKLKRYLIANEEVHHKNGIKTDNRISNLEIVIKSAHFGKIKCPKCLTKLKIK